MPDEPEFQRSFSDKELRKALHQILSAQQDTNSHLHRMDRQMADLQTSLTDLQTAVETAVTDLSSGAVASLQQALATLQAKDDSDVAAKDQALADAQAAADTIEQRVADLNAATGGSTPPAPAV